MTPVPLYRTCASLSVNEPRMCIELPRRSLSAAASAFGHLHTIPSRAPDGDSDKNPYRHDCRHLYYTPRDLCFLPSIDDNLYIRAT